MNRLQILFTCLTSAAILGSAGMAQALPGEGVLTPQILQMADANRDGQVTFDEAKALVPMLTQEAFDSFDVNGDGVLSSADLPEPPMEPGQVLRHLLEVADSNGDGLITFEEAQAVYPSVTLEQFQQYDKNGDNVLSEADLPEVPPQDPLEALVHFLSTADTNNDDAISLAEAQAVIPVLTQAQFDYLDSNGDGVLTRDDLPAALPDDPIRRLLNLLRQADANDDGAISYEEILVLVPDYSQAAFDVLDMNGDGVLSLADLPPGPVSYEQLLALLKQADVNNDEQVTLEELQALVPQVTSDQFNQLDRNDDGVISREDLPSTPPENLYVRLLRLFKEADANEDQQVTLAELQAIIPTFTQHAFDYIDVNGDGFITREDLPGGPPPTELEMLKHLLRMADADENGEVTFAELQALVPELAQEQFDRLDRNGDGVISAADLPSLPEDPMEWLLRVLREADANGDSQVTFEELQGVVPNVTQEQFGRLDRNGDGIISVEDKPDPPVDPLQRLIRLLREADVDQNEEVTFAELLAVYPELTQEQFDTVDRNGDGVISAADLPDKPEDPRDRLFRLLREADVNDDQQVTFEELQAVAPEVTQEQFDQLDRNLDGVLSAADLPDSPIPPDDVSRIELLRAVIQADLNRDGQLDFNEIAAAFPDAPAELLAIIDTDHNWLITRAEVRTALQFAHDGGLLVQNEDVNASGKTDAGDVQLVINHALNRLGAYLLADISGDNRVNATDVQQVINGVLQSK